MRELSSTSGAEALSTGIVAEPLASTALLEARTRLAHALQTSLEARELLEQFYRHSQKLVSYQGLNYESRTLGEIRLGTRAVNQCHYTMSLPDTELGEISFFRRQRFSDGEQQMLETLLASLAFPLKNAQTYQRALTLALVDPLTGVGNRTALDNALEREHQLLKRGGKAFSLIMLDIDHFKAINDKHGHGRGDEVIAQVAAAIESVSRRTDMTFRYGGEEFALLLPDTGAAGALITAERLRRGIEKLQIRHGSAIIAPTVSVGASACVNGTEPVTGVLDRADRALYNAKRNGRNRSCCEPPADYPPAAFTS